MNTQLINNSFTQLTSSNEANIRKTYIIIDVDFLDKSVIKNDAVDTIVDYHLKHKDNAIYKKTDYLCDKKTKTCICNKNAEKLREIFQQQNYVPGEKYISFMYYK